mmetsp:Transcript_27448/g.40806  ORF Transcript_27448/g.40806 Transcript_27448/m.40806 type:complete len:96 (-) Transcript_27448:175-462(-)
MHPLTKRQASSPLNREQYDVGLEVGYDDGIELNDLYDLDKCTCLDLSLGVLVDFDVCVLLMLDFSVGARVGVLVDFEVYVLSMLDFSVGALLVDD